MSWEDIIKSDMEQYERRMLSREKGGDSSDGIDIKTVMDELIKEQFKIGNIVSMCEESLQQLDRRPELADKKYIDDVLSEIRKIAMQR